MLKYTVMKLLAACNGIKWLLPFMVVGGKSLDLYMFLQYILQGPQNAYFERQLCNSSDDKSFPGSKSGQT